MFYFFLTKKLFVKIMNNIQGIADDWLDKCCLAKRAAKPSKKSKKQISLFIYVNIKVE